MRILWGACAVSVEMMGVMLVLWMLHGATSLAINMPWGTTTASPVAAAEPRDPSNTPMANAVPVAAIARRELAGDASPVQDETQRATVVQWFNTLFPARVDKTFEQQEMDQRAEYARERLDHFSRLYGIASRD